MRADSSTMRCDSRRSLAPASGARGAIVCRNRAKTVATSACACGRSSVFSRPMMTIQLKSGRCSQLLRRSCGSLAIGTKKSDGRPTAGSPNPWGSTPTIVKGTASTRKVRPMASGPPPNARCHQPYRSPRSLPDRPHRPKRRAGGRRAPKRRAPRRSWSTPCVPSPAPAPRRPAASSSSTSRRRRRMSWWCREAVRRWVREAATAAEGRDAPELDQLSGIGDRQLAQHQRVDQAEDRGVAADADAE